jgi:NADH dehydrogenase
MPSKTIAVTGASGVVGRYVVRELLERGYGVRALVRSRDKARATLPSGQGLSLVVGDISEHGVADRLLDGAWGCINLLGILRESRGELGARPQTFQRIHVEATRLLVHRCEELGVQRYVQMSALGVSDMGVSDYQRTKFEAEMIVRLSSLDWTIFRPSIIHAPESEFLKMCKEWAAGHAAPYVFMPYFTRHVEDKRVPLGPMHSIDPKVAPVLVDDVARAFAACLESPRTVGEVYNLVGSQTMTWPEMLREIRDHVHGAHHEQPVFGIPGEAAAKMAELAKLIGLGGVLPFDEGMARMGAQDSVASLEKFREDFGFDPAPFAESFEGYASAV